MATRTEPTLHCAKFERILNPAMCIAFPKAADGDDGREPGWKSALLFLPRLLALAWLVTKLFGEALLGWLREKRHQAQ